MRPSVIARTAKSGIDVLVMRLEPVTERCPQHASRGPRRSALHDIVFSVKEICRISGIKRERHETGKRLKWGRGPFPSIAQHVFDAESACSAGMRVNRHRLPGSK